MEATRSGSKACLPAQHWIHRVQSSARTMAGTAAAATAGAVLLSAGVVGAADHRDSDNQLGNPQADINDVYAFMNPADANELVLVMTVVRDAQAGDTFGTDLSHNFLVEDGSGTNYRLSCVFPSTETVSCSLGTLVVAGAVGGTVGSADTGMRVFTGLRDDPFYFNATGLAMTFAADPATPMFAEAQAANGGEANSFEGEDTLAIVIGVNRTLLVTDPAMPVLKLWATTEPLSTAGSL